MNILPDDIVLKITNYLPFKDLVNFSTVDRATRALLHSADFIRGRATIIAPDPPGLLRKMDRQYRIGGDGTSIPYNDAHGRLHHIRLDILVPCNTDDSVKVEASHGGYILYSTTPPLRGRLRPESDTCICHPINLYRTVLPRPGFPISLFIDSSTFALLFVNGAAPNIRYRIAFLSFLFLNDVRVAAYDSGNDRGWQQFKLPLEARNYDNQRAILGELAAANFQSLFVYKYPDDDFSIWVLDLEAQLVRVVTCPPRFDCCDVFMDHSNNRILALGMVPDPQGGRRTRFSFLELQLQGPPNLGWTGATLAEESERLNDQLAREPAYSIRWRISRALNLNSLLFQRRNRFALYNISEGSWRRFNVRGPHFRPELYLDFHPP